MPTKNAFIMQYTLFPGCVEPQKVLQDLEPIALEEAIRLADDYASTGDGSTYVVEVQGVPVYIGGK